jgi:hypothetical protein
LAQRPTTCTLTASCSRRLRQGRLATARCATARRCARPIILALQTACGQDRARGYACEPKTFPHPPSFRLKCWWPGGCGKVLVRPGAQARLGRPRPRRAVGQDRQARPRNHCAAARGGSHASRMVSLSLSCGTWLRALEHVPQERLKETFRLAKAIAKMRAEVSLAAKNDLIKEPRRSSPLPGPGCVVVVFCFSWSLSWFFPGFPGPV